MTKREVENLETELIAGKTPRAKKAKKKAKKVAKKVRKSTDLAVRKQNATNSTKNTPKKALNETQKRVILMLTESNGTRTVTDICAELKIDRKTYYNWVHEFPEIKEATKAAYDSQLDYVQFLLFGFAEDDPKTAMYLHDQLLKHPYAFRRNRIEDAYKEHLKEIAMPANPEIKTETVIINLGGGERPDDDRDLSTLIDITELQ